MANGGLLNGMGWRARLGGPGKGGAWSLDQSVEFGDDMTRCSRFLWSGGQEMWAVFYSDRWRFARDDRSVCFRMVGRVQFRWGLLAQIKVSGD
jgi:hypothetical protein